MHLGCIFPSKWEPTPASQTRTIYPRGYLPSVIGPLAIVAVPLYWWEPQAGISLELYPTLSCRGSPNWNHWESWWERDTFFQHTLSSDHMAILIEFFWRNFFISICNGHYKIQWSWHFHILFWSYLVSSLWADGPSYRWGRVHVLVVELWRGWLVNVCVDSCKVCPVV